MVSEGSMVSVLGSEHVLRIVSTADLRALVESNRSMGVGEGRLSGEWARGSCAYWQMSLLWKSKRARAPSKCSRCRQLSLGGQGADLEQGSAAGAGSN